MRENDLNIYKLYLFRANIMKILIIIINRLKIIQASSVFKREFSLNSVTVEINILVCKQRLGWTSPDINEKYFFVSNYGL